MEKLAMGCSGFLLRKNGPQEEINTSTFRSRCDTQQHDALQSDRLAAILHEGNM